MMEEDDVWTTGEIESHSPQTAWCASDLQYRHILDHLPAAAYTCDREGLITYFNEAASRLWGRAPFPDSRDRFCGPIALSEPDGTPVSRDQCWAAMALATDRPVRGQAVVVQRVDGERVRILASATPLRGDSGQTGGAICVLTEIRDTPHPQVGEPETGAELRELLATLEHELRNSLATIAIASQLLRDSEPDSIDQRRALGIIDRQIHEMTRLLQELPAPELPGSRDLGD